MRLRAPGRKTYLCTCQMFIGPIMVGHGPESPCLNAQTGEDMLCDPCREDKLARREIATFTAEQQERLGTRFAHTTGIGPAPHDNRESCGRPVRWADVRQEVTA